MIVASESTRFSMGDSQCGNAFSLYAKLAIDEIENQQGRYGLLRVLEKTIPVVNAHHRAMKKLRDEKRWRKSTPSLDVFGKVGK